MKEIKINTDARNLSRWNVSSHYHLKKGGDGSHLSGEVTALATPSPVYPRGPTVESPSIKTRSLSPVSTTTHLNGKQLDRHTVAQPN